MTWLLIENSRPKVTQRFAVQMDKITMIQYGDKDVDLIVDSEDYWDFSPEDWQNKRTTSSFAEVDHFLMGKDAS